MPDKRSCFHRDFPLGRWFIQHYKSHLAALNRSGERQRKRQMERRWILERWDKSGKPKTQGMHLLCSASTLFQRLLYSIRQMLLKNVFFSICVQISFLLEIEILLNELFNMTSNLDGLLTRSVLLTINWTICYVLCVLYGNLFYLDAYHYIIFHIYS